MLHLDFKIFLITSLRVTVHITIEIITECFNVLKISKSKEKLLYTKKIPHFTLTLFATIVRE